jgi:hypothetical protein
MFSLIVTGWSNLLARLLSFTALPFVVLVAVAGSRLQVHASALQQAHQVETPTPTCFRISVLFFLAFTLIGIVKAPHFGFSLSSHGESHLNATLTHGS